MNHPSLAHRLIEYYRPPAIDNPQPGADAEGADEPSRQMVQFLYSVSDRLAEDPGILDLPEAPDGHFDRSRMYKQDPGLKKRISTVARRIHRLYDFLIDIGVLGMAEKRTLFVSQEQLKITPKKGALLESVGLEIDRTEKSRTGVRHPNFPDLAEGWRSLADAASSQGKAGLLYFTQGILAHSVEAVLEALAREIGDPGILKNYADYLEQTGYVPELDVSADRIEVRIVYSKRFKANRRSLGGLILHTNPLRGNSPAVSVDLIEPLEFMRSYDGMDSVLQSYVYQKARECNGCGYCIQTDKKQKLKAMTLRYNGLVARKCPYFMPTRWDRFDKDVVSLMRKLVSRDEAVVIGAV